ncbi:hypothetical protein [Micromonospora sp. NBC_01813]|uniref:hypothetical protein n=1 Tax=Micromonospora sp. NBC_01813 TaxID=2975988 RepID=UPI002DD91E51|nr:hypothetical protein [Micromonospora sp. NBC_01813]WSA11546.1 hypothetical protein OG958_12625 [Micromonospora sp. NBC_01813]
MTYSSVTGRTYVLILSKTTATGAVTDVEDDADNEWERLDYAPKTGSAGRRIEAWICTPTVPFSEITVTNPGGQTYGVLVEVTGSNGVVNAVNADFRTGSTSPARVEITPTQADTLVIAAVMANSNTVADITAPPEWTALASHADGPKVIYRTGVAADVAVGVDYEFEVSQGSGHIILALEAGADVSIAVTVWVGGVELPAHIEGVWNGASIDSASISSLT